MNQNLVIPLPTAQAIAALGVKVESENVWHTDGQRYGWILCKNDDIRYPMGTQRLPAYTLGELPAVLEREKPFFEASERQEGYLYGLNKAFLIAQKYTK